MMHHIVCAGAQGAKCKVQSRKVIKVQRTKKCKNVQTASKPTSFPRTQRQLVDVACDCPLWPFAILDYSRGGSFCAGDKQDEPPHALFSWLANSTSSLRKSPYLLRTRGSYVLVVGTYLGYLSTYQKARAVHGVVGPSRSSVATCKHAP